MRLHHIARHLTDPPQNYFLFGPLGTGKTTWLEQRYPEALFVDLLEPETAMSLQARPSRLRELVMGGSAAMRPYAA
jgi:hypothetical protein